MKGKLMDRNFKARCLKDRSWKTGFFLIKKKEPCIKDIKNVWPVHEQTICQSTGYLDCNKKEIFIDDLIKFSAELNGKKIEFEEIQVVFDPVYAKLVLFAGDKTYDFMNPEYKNVRYEIIGNIWDKIALAKRK